MWFSLFAAVLILAVAFYEGLQGLFTALINCILAILAAALAFGLYEDLYFALLKEYQPDHGRAIALLGIFIVSLLVLRTFLDVLIKGNLQFPLYVDRAGGGVLGFITGMIVVGMLSIGFEMLPFGTTILSFARMPLVEKGTNQPIPDAELPQKDPAQLEYIRSSPWLRQDEFTVALVSHLSGNALHGRNRLGDFYPDFMAQAYRSRARMGDEMSTTTTSEMNVDGYWDIRQNEFFTRESSSKEDPKKLSLVASKNQPKPGHKRLAVRVAFSNADSLKFTPEQVRLVIRDEQRGESGEYFLVGINDAKAGNKLVQTWAGEIISRSPGGKDNKLDFVFEVPENAEFGEGSFVELKQNARAEITPRMDRNKKRPVALGAPGAKAPANGSAAEPSPAPRQPAPQSGGASRRPSGPSNRSTSNHDRVSGIGPAREALVSDKLPFETPLTQYGGNAEVSNGAIRGGRLLATLTDDWQPVPGNSSPVESIYVPSDMRLIQVNLEKLQPGSVLGQAMGFARDNIADYKLYDARGTAYLPVGMYGLARVGGRPTFEMVLLDETARQGDDVFAKLPHFERIKRQDFTGDYALYFVYQVKVGTRATKIYTGRTDVNLEKFNLVAE
ncbi:MAG TPA: hypothetical protein PKG54_02705 [Phycisphaerae bacterium]|jgi:uncharacterized membrane protein required for colicin V production|nr:hypothetical protein [Phycisphaerae bacterium]HOB73413.1 hypothetical protein [Phycisphaerae bacterium]HPU33469.1 hypothetical protein [Phycisphaerae bacterium]HQA44036.1 hypothetical protein [Phycisphaerae bacterium]HQE44308.1 hypothetical protein [Phycisphaerae bacterium]